MRWPKTMLGTFLVTLTVWLLFTWPLPKHVLTGIPAAAHHTPAEVLPMIPGDHLQFMYYCWLAGDWLAGSTPFFYNLYEFNSGDLRACYHPDTYYIPFSLIFNAGAWLGGRAFGWNLTGFVSLWLTYLLTLLLARRYAGSERLAWTAALLGLLLPYRWVNLLGGSPAGFAMMWPPAVLLGVDLAVRDGRRAGGWLAGLALLGAAWGDQHVFFFSTLAAAGWCVVAFAARAEQPLLSWAFFRRTVLALLPFVLLLGFALIFPRLMKGLTKFVTGLPPADFSVGARHWREVMNYSPEWPGFWGRSLLGISDQIYLGYTITALLLLGWLAGLWQALRDPRPYGRRFAVLTLLGVGTALALALALGYRGPRDARLYKYACRLIHPYALIRQPAKILTLLPTLLAVGAALAFAALDVGQRRRLGRIALPAALGIHRLDPSDDLAAGDAASGLRRRRGGCRAAAGGPARAGDHALARRLALRLALPALCFTVPCTDGQRLQPLHQERLFCGRLSSLRERQPGLHHRRSVGPVTRNRRPLPALPRRSVSGKGQPVPGGAHAEKSAWPSAPGAAQAGRSRLGVPHSGHRPVTSRSCAGLEPVFPGTPVGSGTLRGQAHVHRAEGQDGRRAGLRHAEPDQLGPRAAAGAPARPPHPALADPRPRPGRTAVHAAAGSAARRRQRAHGKQDVLDVAQPARDRIHQLCAGQPEAGAAVRQHGSRHR